MNLSANRDVMKHYTYVRLEHSNKMNSKEQPSVAEVATIVAKKLEAIWQKLRKHLFQPYPEQEFFNR